MSRVRTVTPGGTRLLGRPLDSGPEPEGSAVMREGALDSLRPNRTATCLLGPPAAPLHQQEGGLSPAPGATVLCGLHPTPHNGVCEAKLLSRGTPLRVQSTWAWAPSPQRKGRKGTDNTHHSHPDGTKNKRPELPVSPPPPPRVGRCLSQSLQAFSALISIRATSPALLHKNHPGPCESNTRGDTATPQAVPVKPGPAGQRDLCAAGRLGSTASGRARGERAGSQTRE